MTDDDRSQETPPTNPKPEDKPDTGDEPKGTEDVEKWKAMARKHEREAKAAAKKLQEIEDAGKSETDKLREEAANAKKEAEAARKDALKLKVGLDKGLPKSLITRLQGETEEDLAADADELLTELKPKAPTGDADGGKRGATPDSTKDMDALLRAAAGR